MINDIKKYLNNGPQTEITPLIKKITASFKSKDLYLILEILNWLKNNFKATNSTEEKIKLFRKRTASDILKSRIVTGCTDYALAFIALARAKDIPTKYVETIRRKWLDLGNKDHIEGHIFAECFINNKWYIIDPQEGAIKIDYKRFVIFKQGLDSWNIGIKNFNELKTQFWDFKKKYKKNQK